MTIPTLVLPIHTPGLANLPAPLPALPAELAAPAAGAVPVGPALPVGAGLGGVTLEAVLLEGEGVGVGVAAAVVFGALVGCGADGEDAGLALGSGAEEVLVVVDESGLSVAAAEGGRVEVEAEGSPVVALLPLSSPPLPRPLDTVLTITLCADTKAWGTPPSGFCWSQKPEMAAWALG